MCSNMKVPMPIGSIKAQNGTMPSSLENMFQCQLVQLKLEKLKNFIKEKASSNANWFN